MNNNNNINTVEELLHQLLQELERVSDREAKANRLACRIWEMLNNGPELSPDRRKSLEERQHIACLHESNLFDECKRLSSASGVIFEFMEGSFQRK